MIDRKIAPLPPKKKDLEHEGELVNPNDKNVIGLETLGKKMDEIKELQEFRSDLEGRLFRRTFCIIIFKFYITKKYDLSEKQAELLKKTIDKEIEEKRKELNKIIDEYKEG